MRRNGTGGLEEAEGERGGGSRTKPPWCESHLILPPSHSRIQIYHIISIQAPRARLSPQYRNLRRDPLANSRPAANGGRRRRRRCSSPLPSGFGVFSVVNRGLSNINRALVARGKRSRWLPTRRETRRPLGARRAARKSGSLVLCRRPFFSVFPDFRFVCQSVRLFFMKMKSKKTPIFCICTNIHDSLACCYSGNT